MALYKVIVAITPLSDEKEDELGQPTGMATEFITKYVVTDEVEMISSVIVHQLVESDYFYGINSITKICNDDEIYIDGMEELIGIANYFRKKVKLRYNKY